MGRFKIRLLASPKVKGGISHCVWLPNEIAVHIQVKNGMKIPKPNPKTGAESNISTILDLYMFGFGFSKLICRKTNSWLTISIFVSLAKATVFSSLETSLVPTESPTNTSSGCQTRMARFVFHIRRGRLSALTILGSSRGSLSQRYRH